MYQRNWLFPEKTRGVLVAVILGSGQSGLLRTVWEMKLGMVDRAARFEQLQFRRIFSTLTNSRKLTVYKHPNISRQLPMQVGTLKLLKKNYANTTARDLLFVTNFDWKVVTFKLTLLLLLCISFVRHARWTVRKSNHGLRVSNWR